MNKKQAFKELEEINKKEVLVSHIAAVLEWDSETVMKEKASEARGEQMSYLSLKEHEITSNPKIGELLSVLENVDEMSDRDKAIIRFQKKDFKQATKIPAELEGKLAEETNRCQTKWYEARKTGDWKSFEPYFEKVFELVKEKGECLKEDKSLYNTLLDNFEEGMTEEKITKLFDNMEKSIHEVMDFTVGIPVKDDFLYKKYSNEKKEAFAKIILKDMGFDFDRGTTGIAVHPFTISLGRDDIRITSRFTDSNVADCLFSYIHEGGHALYEMGASNEQTYNTTLANGASMGFHESQSRLWENVIGHSPAFWTHYFPIFKDMFPEQLKGVSFDQFIKALNKVKPTDIRVNADEVTYSLHIILRFRLESELFSGNLKIKDLPEAWNEMSKKVIGKAPDSIKTGVLQDVHWPAGLFGYFPSYAIGNLYNSQIIYDMNKELPVNCLLKAGKLEPIHAYLNNKIYKYGMIYTPEQLIKKVTGSSLSEKYFDAYLKERYSELYK